MESSPNKFMADVQETVNALQEKGLKVEIQYRYDDRKNIAFIVGREKEN